MNREIVVVGLSHHTAPVEARERLAISAGCSSGRTSRKA
jgi:hypothetical protein